MVRGAGLNPAGAARLGVRFYPLSSNDKRFDMTEQTRALERLQKIWDQGGRINFFFVPGGTREEYYEAVNQALDAMENDELHEPFSFNDGIGLVTKVADGTGF